MKTKKGKHRNGQSYHGLLVMLLSIAGLMSPAAMAQQATANVNGVVKDPSGAAIANAQVELTNVNTGVVRKTTTNTDGIYTFPSVVPGAYSMQAIGNWLYHGVAAAVTLQVGQTATFDFQLTGRCNHEHRHGNRRSARVGVCNLGTGHGCLTQGNERPAFERP